MSGENNKARIQIVEDEFIIAGEIRRTLENFGYTVTAIVNSGKMAIERAAADLPDVILMDINLKGEMDGIEAARIIRHQNNIPIIFITAYADDEKIERAKQAMPCGYILKPFRDQDLKVTIEMGLYVAAANKKIFENECRLARAERIAGLGSWEMDIKTGKCQWSDEFYRICGYAPGDIEPTAKAGLQVIHPEDRKRAAWCVEAAIRERGNYDIEERIVRPDGTVRTVHALGEIICDSSGKPVKLIGTIHDITEKRILEYENFLNLKRLEISQEIATLQNAEEKEVCDIVLERMQELSDSKIGFIGFMTEDEQTMKIHSWSNNAMEKCRIIKMPMAFPIEHAGLWGEPVRRRKPIIINDYNESHPAKKGYPEGHVPVTRFLSSPVFEDERIVAVAAVGNKEIPYTPTDVEQLNFLMQSVWEQIRRKRTDMLIKENEENLSLAQELAHIGSWKYELETGSLFWSEELYRIYGLHPEKTNLRLEQALGMIHPEDKAFTEGVFKKAVEDGISYEIEYRIIRPDGRVRFVQGIGKIEKDQSGNIVFVFGTGQDITERKKIENKLKDQEKILSDILESTLSGYWDWNIKGKTIYLSPAFKKMFGYEDHELENRPETWQQLILPEDLPGVIKIFKKHVESHGQHPYYNEVRYRHKDGSIVWVICAGRVIEWADDGAPIRMVGCHVDITQRKKAEIEKKISEDKFSKIFNHAPLMIAISDFSTGTIVDVNQEHLKVSGYTRQEIVGKTSFELQWIAPDDRQYLAELMQTHGFVQNREVTLWTKKRLPLHCLYSGFIIDLNNKPHIVSISQDLTSLKETEDKNRELQEQLLKVQKMESIGTLAGGIAHDFNNILYPIIGHAEMLMEDLLPNSPYQHHVKNIFNSALRASELVKQILAFSRQSSPVLKPVKVQSIIDEILTLIKHSLPSTIQVKTDIDTSASPVIADDTQVQQVVMNLVTNAFQSMQDEGGTLGIDLAEVSIKEEDPAGISLTAGAYIRLSISDTGAGIDQEIIDRIFDPYFTTKEKGKGTGLGLATAHGIVKSYKGDITVSSEPGKGSSFQVYIPIPEVVATDPEVAVKTKKESGTVKYEKERILFVDDEVFIVDAAFSMLSRMGYLVTTRTNSFEALRIFKKQPDQFDLVITDMTMPHMTGIQLIKEIRRIRQNIPIILCTGFSEQINKQKAKSLGIDALVMKPIVRNQMENIIRSVLDGT